MSIETLIYSSYSSKYKIVLKIHFNDYKRIILRVSSEWIERFRAFIMKTESSITLNGCDLYLFHIF